MTLNSILINERMFKLIPYGHCACGCKELTTIANKTDKSNCITKGQYRKFKKGHHFRGKNHRNWNGGKKISCGYVLVSLPDHPRADVDGYVREHILIAEKALGKPLPPKAIVHHHTPKQLVIGQDQAYHMVLHKRTRAYEACGHANWLKCPFCKKYDDPKNMAVRLKNGRSGKKAAWIQAEHKSCRAEHDRNRRAEKTANLN